MVFRRQHLPFWLYSILAAIILSGCVLENSNPNQTEVPDISLEYSCVNLEQSPQTARVISITDGDTIVVEMEGKEYRVRYIGINAPELASDEHSFAEQATRLNRDLVEDEMVALYRDISETDRFDRLLRYVFVGDVFINYALVEKGSARQRDYPPDSACKDLLEQAQHSAQQAKVGIWNNQ